jgi:hypothetical protein
VAQRWAQTAWSAPGRGGVPCLRVHQAVQASGGDRWASLRPSRQSVTSLHGGSSSAWKMMLVICFWSTLGSESAC